jgi:hypothetical protein
MDPSEFAETNGTEERIDGPNHELDENGIGPEDPDPDEPDGSLWDTFWNTEPDPPLETVSNPWDPERGGYRRIFRGVQKLSGVDGMPAWADIIVGTIELLVDQDGSDVDVDRDRDQDDVASDPADGLDAITAG